MWHAQFIIYATLWLAHLFTCHLVVVVIVVVVVTAVSDIMTAKTLRQINIAFRRRTHTHKRANEVNMFDYMCICVCVCVAVCLLIEKRE